MIGESKRKMNETHVLDPSRPRSCRLCSSWTGICVKMWSFSSSDRASIAATRRKLQIFLKLKPRNGLLCRHCCRRRVLGTWRCGPWPASCAPIAASTVWCRCPPPRRRLILFGPATTRRRTRSSRAARRRAWTTAPWRGARRRGSDRSRTAPARTAIASARCGAAFRCRRSASPAVSSRGFSPRSGCSPRADIALLNWQRHQRSENKVESIRFLGMRNQSQYLQRLSSFFVCGVLQTVPVHTEQLIASLQLAASVGRSAG